MDEEVFNQQIRKFLKKVGITSQREIEKAVRAGLDSGKLQPTQTVRVSVLLQLPELGVELPIDSYWLRGDPTYFRPHLFILTQENNHEKASYSDIPDT